MRVAASTCLLVVIGLLTETHALAEKPDRPKDKPRGEVVLRLISENDSWWPENNNNPPSTLRLMDNGKLTNGSLVFDPAKVRDFLVQTDEERKHGRPAYLVVDVTDSKMPLPILIEGLNAIRASTPPDTNAVIFIRVRGLTRFPPRGK
jgi:hypothetical protein